MTYSLTSDTAVEDDFDQCNDRADTILVDNVERGEPAVAENLINSEMLAKQIVAGRGTYLECWPSPVEPRWPNE